MPDPDRTPASRPPTPEARPSSRTLFGDTCVDEYAWLREREDPAVRAHLEAERAHAEAVIDGRTGDLRERLYAEMRGRIREDARSLPSKDGPWLYYSRTETGDEYSRHCRRPWREGMAETLAQLEADAARFPELEQVYVDENALAAGCDYFELASLVLSPDHRRALITVDTAGDEIYTLSVLEFDSQGDAATLDEAIEGCGGSATWIDGEVFLYDRLDDAHRPWQIWRHRVGTPASADVLVHQEDDERFFLSIGRTRSQAFVIISADSQVSSEVYLIPVAAPEASPRSVASRVQGVEYGVDHRGDELFILTNEGALDFKLMVAKVDPDGALAAEHRDRASWLERIPHREGVMLEEVELFAEHTVVWERVNGLLQVRIFDADADAEVEPGPEARTLDFPDPTYAIWPGSNPEFDSPRLRLGYTSLTTPTSIYDYDLRSGTRTLRKRSEVVGGHEPADYRSARMWATAPDGARVPMSVVWRRTDADSDTDAGADQPPPGPVLLYAYGAYGSPIDPSFSSSRLSLLDRGMPYAIAHVRGGGALGRAWYEGGKLEHKARTFTDFIACAEHLVEVGVTTPAQLVAMGGSAGGLLIGAVANLRPDLFTAMIADVPFVDVLSTMLDPSLPLTAIEWEEWGNPAEAEGYRWIRAYSPYDNVTAQAYPELFVLAGWNDPRVGYWEPAKWVARLRERRTDGGGALLWTNMEAGHAGASGRFEYLRELALEYAFLIDHLGLPAALPTQG